ncbi:MAG: STAS domain-containing protein [Streptosporangiaceae bacterium]
MYPGNQTTPSLSLSAQTAAGITVAELAGELDIACAPALREQLLGLLWPGSGRLVIDLSEVSLCDASGLAVLVGTGRRAKLLGGFLRLAAVSPVVDRALHITGLHRHLDVFPTVQAAIAGPQGPPHGNAGARAAEAHPGPAGSHAGHPKATINAGELREAAAALLANADAWRDADPGRRFATALRAMARAHDGADTAALDAAARSVLSALDRHPLSYSPVVAATATRLRRAFNPRRRPALT